MADSNLISNISYTSRDFNSIYPELLDLVKKITYKWDPSISNESDPGVILLKLNALVADKCNYNIDKNVLECFPLSVTQDSNARQLYEQLGYFMHWYRSATTQVSLSWKDFDNYENSSTNYIQIPRFVMVSDYDNSVIYTLTSPAGAEQNSAANIKLYMDGEPVVFNAIQGVNVNYDINGQNVIQVTDLDSNNRLYFNTNDIAENGIFITNIDQENYASWVRKDNLATENLGNTYYSFGVLPGSETCYIEFPQDAATIFKNGINIVYVRTSGKDGNVPARYLDKFYNDVIAVSNVNGEEDTINLTEDNISLMNIVVGEGGRDKESLDEAYRNYKHTIGTFNTLITLRDYINAIINGPELVSNAIVTDRSNDIQCSYKIMSSINNISTLVNKVDTHEDNPAMNAYNMKIYALQYAATDIDTVDEYNQSFQLLTDTELEKIKLYLESEKAIPHDYSSIRTPEQSISYELLQTKPNDWDEDCTQYYYIDGGGQRQSVPAGTAFTANTYYMKNSVFKSHYCLFKNIYPIDCRITPIRTLNDAEKIDLRSNIRKAICEALNSKMLDFGQTITAFQLEEIITQADERISSTSIQNVYMTTYATYWNGKEFKTINLSRGSDSDNPEPYLYSYSSPKYKDVVAADTFMAQVGDVEWGVYTFKWVAGNPSGVWAMSKIEGNDGPSAFVVVNNISDYCNVMEVVASPQNNDWFSIEINPVDRFRDEIYVKSVLQGVTPLYVKDKDFDFDIDQLQIISSTGNGIIDNVESIECNTTIEIERATPYYTLRDNESIRFATSNLLDGSQFSNYVKYYYVSNKLNPTIHTNSNKILEQGEFLFLFWKETDNSLDPYVYEVYSEGNVVCPSFELTVDAQTIIGTPLQEIADHVVNVGSEFSPRYMTNYIKYRGLKSAENTYVDSIRNWLSGTKTIQMKYVNAIRIPDYYLCYWVLNNKTVDGRYVLFDDYTSIEDYSTSENYTVGNKVKYQSDYYECISATSGTFDDSCWKILSADEYTLDTGEYFFYKTSSGSVLNILGAGTRIQRPTTLLNEWSVNATSLQNINANSEALDNLWFIIPQGLYIDITEQQYVNVGAGATVYIEYEAGGHDFTITSDEYTELDHVKSIRYTFNKLTDAEKQVITNYDSVLPDIGNIDNWRARSILSLAVGEDEEQILLDGQTLTLNIYNSDTPIIIQGQDEGNDRYPVVIQSLLDIDTISSNGIIYTYTFDEDANVIFNKIYEYSELKSTEDIIYGSDGGATIVYRGGSTTPAARNIDLQFSVPATTEDYQGYIFSLYNAYPELIGAILTASISTDGTNFTTLYPIGTKTDSNLANPGTYFFDIDINQEVTYTLRISLSNLIYSEDVSILINHLYRYVKPDNITAEKFEDYTELLTQFDPDRQFQYVYDIPENILIEDPLDPQSFLDPHHIYNGFTICQADTRNQTFVISTR